MARPGWMGLFLFVTISKKTFNPRITKAQQLDLKDEKHCKNY
jgi:hypothetical protein